MNRWLLAVIILASAATAKAQDAPATGRAQWTVTDSTSPITDARTLAATLQSSNEILNILGRPDRAALTIRCSEGGLAVYVSWTEVVNQSSTNVMGQPKTLAVWRIDSGKLIANFWDIDTTGTAAGEFKHRNAEKLLATFVGAKKLAVRLSGRQTQDVEFELDGIDQVANEAAKTCGISLASKR